MINYLLDLDSQLFVFINQFGVSNFMDSFMTFSSKASTWIILYVAFVYLFYKKWGKYFFIPVIILAMTIAASDRISSGLLKPSIKRPRPCKVEALHARTPTGCNSPYGFVSSHASNHAALALFVILILNPPFVISALLIIWTLLIAYSRVYLGVHYPGDVLFGMILGSLLSLLSYPIHLWTMKRFSVNSQS